jgi:hypothetical protein
MSETALMHRIQLALSDAGHVCFRANVGTFRTQDGRWFSTGLPPGFSDLFGVTVSGRPFFFEVKTAAGKVRPDQDAFIDAMQKHGAIAAVVRSVDEALTFAK